jgi:O-antigen/teichoic acid export membrane protein
MFMEGCRLAVGVSLLYGAIILAATPLAVPFLFGKDFEVAVPVALVMVVAGAIDGFNRVIEEGFRGLGRPGVVAWAEIGGLLASVAGLFALLRVGIIGAALASVFGYFVTAYFLVTRGRVLLGSSVCELVCPRLSELLAGLRRLARFVRSSL